MDLEANNEFDNPRYSELLMANYYTEHILRMPLNTWPKSVNLLFEHLNPNIYIYMQGHSEFGMTKDATLKNWDVTTELKNIAVPTLVIGAEHDTMDPEHMKWISTEVQNGRYLHCPNGSHLSQYDDQKVFFTGLIKFIKDVDQNKF